MGILDWIFREPKFKRFDDAFTLTRERLWEALKGSIESPNHAEKSIWLVVHFIDTFTELQERLESWGLEYDVVSSRLATNEVDRQELLESTSIKLILAELIPEPDEISQVLEAEKRKLAMIVVERHPILEEDDRLHRFAMSLPLAVEFGYYLALDDDVVKLAINDTTVEVLLQLGSKRSRIDRQ